METQDEKSATIERKLIKEGPHAAPGVTVVEGWNKVAELFQLSVPKLRERLRSDRRLRRHIKQVETPQGFKPICRSDASVRYIDDLGSIDMNKVDAASVRVTKARQPRTNRRSQN